MDEGDLKQLSVKKSGCNTVRLISEKDKLEDSI